MLCALLVFWDRDVMTVSVVGRFIIYFSLIMVLPHHRTPNDQQTKLQYYGDRRRCYNSSFQSERMQFYKIISDVYIDDFFTSHARVV